MKSTGWIALILVVTACTTAPGEEASNAIPAADLGLAPGDLSADPSPANYTVVDLDSVLARPYRGAPPLIPHDNADFLPITREDNFCLECHMLEESVEGEATAIPASHYTDLRNSPGKVGDQITGARWNCVACHVGQTDANPLVESLFHGGSPGR